MLTDILKERGMFSKDIKTRFANKQIKVNGIALSEDIDIGDVEMSMLDIGEFVFSLMNNTVWALRLKVFGLEELVSSNIENDLTKFLKNFLIVRTSKKDVFVIKRKDKQM